MTYYAGGSGEIGDNIAFMRKLRGLTQEQLAKKLGITQSAVSKFELHGEKVQNATLVRVAEALEVEPTLLYFKDLHDEGAPYHDIVEYAVKTYAPEDQYIEMLKDIEYENEQRRIGMYTGKTVSPEEAEIIDLFGKLNINGQREAVKRVEELTLLDRYKKEV